VTFKVIHLLQSFSYVIFLYNCVAANQISLTQCILLSAAIADLLVLQLYWY